jgi:predicted ester cyclase
MSSEAGIAVVRRNTEEVQSRGNFEVFEDLFAADFVDHTPQPGGFTPDRDGARNLYRALRAAFPDFHAEIHWQISDGDRVTTYKTYHGTHQGTFWGLAPTGRRIHFETVDVMRVHNGKITDHWGVRESPIARAATWSIARFGSGKKVTKRNWASLINDEFYGGRYEITCLVHYRSVPWLRPRNRSRGT